MAWTQSSGSGFQYQRKPLTEQTLSQNNESSETDTSKKLPVNRLSAKQSGHPMIESHGDLRKNMRAALERSRARAQPSLSSTPSEAETAAVSSCGNPPREEREDTGPSMLTPTPESNPRSMRAGSLPCPPGSGLPMQELVPAIEAQPSGEAAPVGSIPQKPAPDFSANPAGNEAVRETTVPPSADTAELELSAMSLPGINTTAVQSSPSPTPGEAVNPPSRALPPLIPDGSAVNWFGGQNFTGTEQDSGLESLPEMNFLYEDEEEAAPTSLSPFSGGLEDRRSPRDMRACLEQRPPERVLCRKGAGAMGRFVPRESMADYTTADFLQHPGEETRVMLRISRLMGHKGTPDTMRGPLGLAFKFYTRRGNCDLLALSLPSLPFSDPSKLSEFIGAIQPRPDTDLHDIALFWDFISRTPESLHFLLWMYGDRGLVKDFSKTDAHSLCTYVWTNDQGKRRYVRCHIQSKAGVEVVEPQEAERLAGTQPDCAHRKLYRDLSRGDALRYILCIQAMEPDMADGLGFDPLDPTKTWPLEQFPLIEAGDLTLDQAPGDYLAQVEWAAFHPANLVQGITLTDHALTKELLSVFTIAQQNRLGINPHNIEVNAPLFQEPSGEMQPQRHTAESLPSLSVQPASTPPGTAEEPPLESRQSVGATDFLTQPKMFYSKLTEQEKARLFTALGKDLCLCEQQLSNRVLRLLHKVSAELSRGVKQALDLQQRY